MVNPMTDPQTIVEGMTRAQRRLLRDLSAGGCFFAALREPGDFMIDGIVFSELVGIIVHRPGSTVAERYRVRNKTAGPLYLADPPLVNCVEGDSGFRCFEITDAGRAHMEK
jgi:hypothetical protein